MRRSLLFSAAAVLALGALVPAAASAEPRPHDDPRRDVEAMRLECAARVTDAGAAIRCEWSAPTSSAASGVVLYRLDPAVDDHRQIVYRSGDLGQTGFTDTSVRPGHQYAYAVVARNADGWLVGRSRVEWVRVPERTDVEVLRLACELGSAHEAVGCEWSRPTSRDTYVVSLWRSVNGGERQLVERFRPSGPNTYRDAVPRDATHITYAVVASAESGEIVARSRPSHVRIPSVDTRPVDTRPVDTRPVDTRPVDTRPVDTRPVDGGSDATARGERVAP